MTHWPFGPASQPDRPEFPLPGELVPHREPMLALDRVLESREGHLRGAMTFDESSPFARGGRIEAVVALEYMAQAVAASLGIECYRGGGAVRVGMIIACREMTLDEPYLDLGVEYEVEANCVHASESTSMFAASMRRKDGPQVAAASMTLVHGTQDDRR